MLAAAIKRHPCVLLAGFYLSGRVAAVLLSDPALPSSLAAAYLGIALFFRTRIGAAVLATLVFLAGAFHGTADAKEQWKGIPFVEREVEGRVLETPEQAVGGETIVRLASAGREYRLKVRPSPEEVQGILRELRHGDRVSVWARTGMPARMGNPTAGVPARSLRSTGIDRVGTVKSARLVRLLGRGDPAFLRLVDHGRAALRQGLDRMCGENAVPRGLLGAMLLGDRAALPPAVVDRLRTAGLVHLIAVSGLHVGLILLLALGIVQRLPLPQRFRLFAVPVILAAMVLLVGNAPSVLRAAAMAWIAVWGIRFGRRAEPLNILAAVGLLMVGLEPLAVYNAGFQLSFAATAGILIGYRPLRRLMPLPSFLAAPLAISGAAYLATSPWTAGLFGTVAPISLLANLGSAPLCGLIILSGYPAMVLSAIGLPAMGTDTMALAACKFLTGLAGMAPGSVLQVPEPSPMVMAGLAAALPLLAGPGKPWTRTALMLVFSLAIIFLHLGKLPPGDGDHALEVIVPDVGQGQAVLVRNGAEVLLVDAGGSRSGTFDIGARVIAPELSRIGVRRLDLLAISHEHMDHAAGAQAILKRFEVGQLWITPGTATRPGIRPLIELAGRRHVPVILAGRGTVYHGRGWHVASLHPGSGNAGLSINDRSLVLEVGTRHHNVLLPGDLERAGEAILLQGTDDPAVLDADLLVAGHHGAANSSSSIFLTAVSPEVVLISAGRGNRFGHPDPLTLGRFGAAGALAGITSRDGLLRWRGDDRGWTLRGYRSGGLAGTQSGK